MFFRNNFRIDFNLHKFFHFRLKNCLQSCGNDRQQMKRGTSKEEQKVHDECRADCAIVEETPMAKNQQLTFDKVFLCLDEVIVSP